VKEICFSSMRGDEVNLVSFGFPLQLRNKAGMTESWIASLTLAMTVDCFADARND
jgi:hypothetical protein